MFICEQCKKQTAAREKQFKKVIDSRPKRYSNGGEGWEIVKEISVCNKCVETNCA